MKRLTIYLKKGNKIKENNKTKLINVVSYNLPFTHKGEVKRKNINSLLSNHTNNIKKYEIK